jgi:hypothetical protein
MKKISHYVRGVYGEELTVDDTRTGHLDDGLIAYDERLAVARRYWPEGKSSDFEQLDRRGRRWRDRATGRVYRREDGCAPLLSPKVEALDCWLVKDGRFVLLIADDRHETSGTVVHGPVRGGEVVDGQIVWKS